MAILSDPTRPDRWLITGLSGRIGQMLARYWRDAPPCAELICQTRHPASSGLYWDILSSPLPRETGQISCLIALAGVTPASGADLMQNAALAEASLAAAWSAGIPRVLLASSSAIYGTPRRNVPFTESDPPNPLSLYGEAKTAMEALCTPWRRRGLSICCLRIGNVVGADMLFTNGLSTRAEHPLKLDRFTDGAGPRRSYIGPSTLARVLETLAGTTMILPDHLNLAAPTPVSMADLASCAGIHWEWTPAPATAVQNITLDCTRLADLHTFTAEDRSPARMVLQWHRLRSS